MHATAEMMTVRHWAPKSRKRMVVPRCTRSMVTSSPAMLSSVESAKRVVGNTPVQKPARKTTDATSSMDTMALVLTETMSPTANTTKMTAAEMIAVIVFSPFVYGWGLRGKQKSDPVCKRRGRSTHFVRGDA